VQTPAKRREQLLDEFEPSGLSNKKFAVLGRGLNIGRMLLGRKSAAANHQIPEVVLAF